jgi:hypothetical protein
MDSRYEIRILGYLGPVLRAAIDGMRCELMPSQTTIRAKLSPGDLRLLLKRLDARGVTLIHLARTGQRLRRIPIDTSRSLSSTQGDAVNTVPVGG